MFDNYTTTIVGMIIMLATTIDNNINIIGFWMLTIGGGATVFMIITTHCIARKCYCDE